MIVSDLGRRFVPHHCPGRVESPQQVHVLTHVENGIEPRNGTECIGAHHERSCGDVGHLGQGGDQGGLGTEVKGASYVLISFDGRSTPVGQTDNSRSHEVDTGRPGRVEVGKTGIEPTVFRHDIAVKKRHEWRRHKSGSGVAGSCGTAGLFVPEHLCRTSLRDVTAPVVGSVIDHDHGDAPCAQRSERVEQPAEGRRPVMNGDHDGHIG